MDAQLQIGSVGGKTTISSRDGLGPEQRRRPASRGFRGEASAATPDPDIYHPAHGLDLTPKRLYDALLSLCGLVVLSPLMAVIGVIIKISDGGEVFYRQLRVGRGGEEFWIYKFRTMVPASDKAGPSVTKNGDSRITWIGRILRKTKLDELPQLLNVLLGDMSLVGPRPEVPRYVRHYTPEQRTILALKPGITDLASLCFRDEEALLENADNLEEFYIKHCIPRKMQLNRDYSRRANLLTDTWIILQTLCPYRIGVLVCYGVLLSASYWLARGLATNFAPPQVSAFQFGQELGLVLALQLLCLTWQRQCNGLLSYFSIPELRQLGVALIVAASGLLAWSSASGGGPALNLILIDALVAFCVMSGFRTLLRRWREWQAGDDDTDIKPARVGIIGAGSTGAQLALELTENRRFGRMVVAFFDDDFHMWQKSIHDVPVAGMPECLLDGWQDKLDEVVIAMPDASQDRVREIENLLSKTRLKFYSISRLAGFPNRRQAA